jgi:signal transduction histidine kinase/ligand-binding sensor domain-containing protein
LSVAVSHLAAGAILWSASGPFLVRPADSPLVLMTGAVHRDARAADTLYLRFGVSPLNEEPEPEAEIGLELWHGDEPHLGIGKARGAAAYSAYFPTSASGTNPPTWEMRDLNSARPEPAAGEHARRFEVPRRGSERTLIVKIQFVPNADDVITVWLDPDLGPGANELYQPETLTTRFYADASFDRVCLRNRNSTAPWWFSDLAIGTTFTDFVEISSAHFPALAIAAPHPPILEVATWPLPSLEPPLPPLKMTLTAEGYLWIAADNGLFRFDGRRFNRVTPPHAPQGGLRHVAVDARGGLWLATDQNEVGRWADDRWQSLPLPPTASNRTVRVLTADEPGRVWLATATELWQWDESQWIRRPRPEGAAGEIQTLIPGAQGDLWLIPAQGPLTLMTTTGSRSLPAPPEPDPSRWIAWCAEGSRRLWLATSDRLWRASVDSDTSGWQSVWQPSDAEHIVGLLPDRSHGVWILLSSGHWVRVGPEASPGPRLRVLSAGAGPMVAISDPEGTMWVLDRVTLYRVRPRWRVIYRTEHGLADTPITGLAEVAPGLLWIAQADLGLLRWTGENFARLSAAGLSARGESPEFVWTAPDGSCWVGTRSRLLRFKDPQAVADEVQDTHLPEAPVHALAEAPDGALWVGTVGGGLWRLQHGERQEQPRPWGQVPVSTLLWEPDGLWIGTLGAGLFHLTPHATNPPQPVDRLPARRVFALLRSRTGTLWVATEAGLWRKATLGWIAVAFEALPPLPVLALAEDDSGRLWLASSPGLACWRPDSAQQKLSIPRTAWWPWDSSAEPDRSFPLQTNAALPMLRTRSGELWIARGSELIVVDTTRAPANRRPTRVLVETVRGNGRTVYSNGPASPRDPPPDQHRPVHLTPGARQVQIEFAVLHVTEPDSVRVSYRLEGVDPDWRDAGELRTVTYGSLAPGRYRFRLRAQSRSFSLDTAETELALVIPPHFWQRPGTAAALGLGLLLAAAACAQAVERRRARRRLAALQHQHALERERARIARDLHDEMGGQLCRISFLSEQARRSQIDPAQRESAVAAIAEASRELLRALDEIVWAVNPANDSLEHLASYLAQYAHDFFQGTPVECEVDLPASLPPVMLPSHVRHHLFRAVREALTNILKHSHATRAELRLRCTPEGMEWIVRDNGRGFDPATPATGADPGQGLANLHHRMSELGGTCRITSLPGQGTEVCLRLPWPPPNPVPPGKP